MTRVGGISPQKGKRCHCKETPTLISAINLVHQIFAVDTRARLAAESHSNPALYYHAALTMPWRGGASVAHVVTLFDQCCRNCRETNIKNSLPYVRILQLPSDITCTWYVAWAKHNTANSSLPTTVYGISSHMPPRATRSTAYRGRPVRRKGWVPGSPKILMTGAQGLTYSSQRYECVPARTSVLPCSEGYLKIRYVGLLPGSLRRKTKLTHTICQLFS